MRCLASWRRGEETPEAVAAEFRIADLLNIVERAMLKVEGALTKK